MPQQDHNMKIRPIEELLDSEDAGWKLVTEWMTEATNEMLVLERDVAKGKAALYNTQVTTRSPLGAIILHTGGILVDHAWIRILGSGSKEMQRSLPTWNQGKSFVNYGEALPFLLVADDAVGGFFALNAGGLGQDHGKMYYFAPDCLEWEPLGLTYSAFLSWTFTGDLADFYQDCRWEGWAEEVPNMGADKIMSFYPFLWMDSRDLEQRKRKAIAVEEFWGVQMDIRDQLRSKRENENG